jgi:hypothetical protein
MYSDRCAVHIVTAGLTMLLICGTNVDVMDKLLAVQRSKPIQHISQKLLRLFKTLGQEHIIRSGGTAPPLHKRSNTYEAIYLFYGTVVLFPDRGQPMIVGCDAG